MAEPLLPSLRPAAGHVLPVAAGLLIVTSWISAALFGLYILCFYGGAVPRGSFDDWNAMLPRIYEAGTPAATIAIGAHFVTGGILLLLGPIQLVGTIRRRLPALHRWLGRAYVLSAALAGAGGLLFIFAKGTVGGRVMDIGFGLYGALMVIAALQSYRHGRARQLTRHRAWGIRLFALAIGSWLYRMEYGFWLPLTGRLGHVSDFSGPFDQVMAFFFYLPNLAVAELYLRAGRRSSGPAKGAAAAVLMLAAGFVCIGTYYFTRRIWGPAVLGSFG